jgi:cyclophilin family peptidyl-prolyl cis-trans isomerase
MDGRYTIFGHVREGMDVVEKLRKGDEIIDVKVFVRPNP